MQITLLPLHQQLHSQHQGQTWDVPSSSWMNVYAYNFTVDSSHNVTEKISETWNNALSAFINTNRVENTYNSSNQLTTMTTDTWNAGSFWEATTSDIQNRYYYEGYTSKVANINAISGNISIYPSPAQSQVHIDINLSNEPSAVITIFDMSGRIMNQWQASNTGSHHTDLSVSQFAAGNYIMRVSSANGSIVKQFSVVR